MNDKPFVIIGAGGHARVAGDACLSSGAKVLGFTDTSLNKGTEVVSDLNVLGQDDVLKEFDRVDVYVTIGIGILPGADIRQRAYERVREWGYMMPPIKHRSAIIGLDVLVAEGAHVMAGCILQPKVTIGHNTIVNTKVSIDHDTVVGDHCHIAPGATVCGGVTIGNNVFVGAGATIIQGVQIADGAVIAAGAVITEDVATGQKAFGRKRNV